MSSNMADHRNKDKNGFHFNLPVPVDSASEYDGFDDLPDGIGDVHLVVVQGQHEEVIVAAFSDADGASLMAEAKNGLVGGLQHATRNVPVHRACPPGEIEEGNIFAFV